ncbi:hypothetical protein O7635_21250 [Asanoa sp. WMMD1127]|uniref:hypothetical protein n=1 Tax=Asanoa sp. WMMD1127 TaxID=3016107 RepID=UPI002416AC22|nr:hypothetical protein [Asanoa sp. WMMD1127]MDG4824386.1 hypothetical protein [Asanoa sp. WMMD1127]
MWWVVVVVAVVAVLATYLTWTAQRVDRLHDRSAAAARALDAHLMRRAAAAAVLAEDRQTPELYAAARIALDAVPEEREAAENDLTRQLRAMDLSAEERREDAVIAASRRLVLARQVHNDLAREAHAARRRRLVRILLLTRRHDRPRFFDIDDPTLTPARAAAPVSPAPVIAQPPAAGVAG